MGHVKSNYQHNEEQSTHKVPGCDSCPLWSRNTQSCLVVKDGLFLPAADHIVAYCETPYFASCSYYQQNILDLQHHEASDTQWENRRQYERHPFRHAFRFSENMENGEMGEVHDDNALTIDLSEGGIRFETRENIPVDTQIAFFLDDEHGPMYGIGRVVWSSAIENSPLFHSGFVFTDSCSSEQVEKLLSLLIP